MAHHRGLALPNRRHSRACPSGLARRAAPLCRVGPALHELSVGAAVPSLAEGTVAEVRRFEEQTTIENSRPGLVSFGPNANAGS